MKNLNSIIFLVLVFFSISCKTPMQVTVNNVYSDESNYNYKLYYALPSTMLKITVVQKKVTYNPGYLANYAENFFGEKAKSSTSLIKFYIDDIQIESAPIFDSTRVFSVSFEGQAINIITNKQGFLSGLNLSSKADFNSCEQNKQAYYNYIINTDEPIKSIPQKYYELSGKGTKAAYLANEVFTLREDRHYLAIGEATNTYLPDGLAIKGMLEYLQNLENQYLKEFYGSTIIEFDTLTYWYLPKKLDFQRETLFKFSESSGISTLTNTNAYPIFLDIKSSNLHQLNHLVDKTKVIRLKNELSNGLAYSIPNVSQVIIRDDLEVYCTKSLNINQLGEIAYLPTSYFDNKTQVKLNPCQGTIISIENNSDN